MKLTFFVTLAHLLLLLFLGVRNKPVEKKAVEKIIVNVLQEKTIDKKPKKIISQPLPEPIEEIAELEPLEINPIPTIAPLPDHEPLVMGEIKVPPKPKVEEKKPIPIKPKPAQKPKEIVKNGSKEKPKPIAKAPPKKQEAPIAKKPDEKLLKMMKEGLSKIDNIPSSITPNKSTTSTNISKMKIEKLQSETMEKMTTVEISYAEELAMTIKHHLHFPEEGNMKIQIILSNKGHVESVTIVSSTSRKNQEIGQKAIADLTFPAFGSRFPNETRKSFTLQLNIE